VLYARLAARAAKNETLKETRAAYGYVRQSSPYQVEHNLESQRRRYAFAQWAEAAGWPKERIVVLDDDQGTTGSLAGTRGGFVEMVKAVGRGEVGLVASLELSRLARNSPDWHQLIYLCRFTDTLIADEHGVYDPAVGADRMVLGIRGQVSEMEVDALIHRMQEARWNKARRGEFLTIPPAGYDVDDLGQFVMTSDESVRHAMETVFAKFDELGSGRQVWVWWLTSVFDGRAYRRPRVGPAVRGRCLPRQQSATRKRRERLPSMTRNITLALDEEVIHRARVIAAKRGLSVSALLRSELLRIVEEEDRFRAARRAALRRLAIGAHLGGAPLPTREELHDRGRLR
jgi:DNA invertase Pin-like site-specific DNA recombinase